MSYIPRLCNIYKGEKFYNIEKNIVRISAKFDKTDVEELIFDVPLISMGINKNPDFRYHKVLAFFPENVEKRSSIVDPVNTEIGGNTIIIPLGILIDNKQYKKVMGSIGHSTYNADSFAGSQDVEDLDFFIPAGVTRKNMINPEIDENDENGDMRICGIGGSKDGGIILRGAGGEINIGAKGISITGAVHFTDGSHEKTGIIKDSPSILELIPKTIVTPFPNRIPNLQKIANVAGIISSVTTFANAIMGRSTGGSSGGGGAGRSF